MAVERQAGPKAGGSGTPGVTGAGQSPQRARNYLQEVLTELKKTTWPTKQEATRLTTVVIGVIIALGIYMGLLDWLLSTLVSKFSLIK